MDVVGKDIYEMEQEWRQALDARIRHLVHTIQQRDSEITELKEKLNVLQKDFFYNLRILEERDTELEKYESTAQSQNELIVKYNDELCDMHMKLDHLQIKYEVLVKENKEQKQWFTKEIDEEKLHHEETKREFQKAAEEWKISFSSRKDISQRQMNELQSNFEQKTHELEEQHSNVICQMKQELCNQQEQAKKDFSRLATKVQQLEQNICDLNLENAKLKTGNASLQLIVHNNKSLFEVEIEQFRTTIKNKDQQLQHIVSTNLIYENEIREVLKNVMDHNNNNQTGEEIKQPLSISETITKLKCEIKGLLMIRDENKILNKELELKIKEISELESLKNTTNEMQTVLKQNQVLREVVKDLKKKLSEMKIQEKNDTKQSINNQNLPLLKQNVLLHDLESVKVSEKCQSNLKLTENTKKEYATSCEIFELLTNHFSDQKHTFESQLQILNKKIENLGKAINEHNIEEESSSRLSRLEKTISQFKEHMLKDIYEKMKGKNKTANPDITPGDIRMMLLEEKIDRIIETVGKTIVSEKNVLLEAVEKIKSEVVTHFMEQIKESNLKNTQKQETQKCNMLKAEEILEQLKKEISRLETKIENENKKVVNNQSNYLHSNLEMNTYKNSKCQTSPFKENLDCNARINLFNEARKRNTSTQVSFLCHANTSCTVSETTSISPAQSEIENLRRLLTDISKGEINSQDSRVELPVQLQRNCRCHKPEQLQSAVLKTKKSTEQFKYRKAN